MIQQYPEPKGVLTQDQKNAYRWVLERLGATKPCARCDAPADKQGVLPASSPLNFFKTHEALSGVQEMQMEMIVLSCLNCGAITLHAQPVLDDAMEKFVGESDDH